MESRQSLRDSGRLYVMMQILYFMGTKGSKTEFIMITQKVSLITLTRMLTVRTVKKG